MHWQREAPQPVFFDTDLFVWNNHKQKGTMEDVKKEKQ